MRHSLWFALLVGCGVPLDFVGEDVGVLPASGGELAAPSSGEAQGAWAGDSDGVGGTVTTPRDSSNLALTGGVGTIDVTHTGLAGPCDATWSMTTVVDGADLMITYDPGASTDTADGCVWDFAYQLQNIPAGTWGVIAAGDEGLVTVQ